MQINIFWICLDLFLNKSNILVWIVIGMCEIESNQKYFFITLYLYLLFEYID